MANHVEARTIATPAPIRIAKLIWGALATLISVLWTAVLGPLAALGASAGLYHATSVLSRIWARGIIAFCGVTVEIEGLENVRGLKSYVLVCNHQSFFDIFAVLAFMPGDTRFVAKKELMQIPVIGYAMRTNGHIIVDRQNGGRTIRKALESARNNYPVCVFAEGHRHNDGRVHEFEEGAAWLAIMAKLPCVPMTVIGSGNFFPREAKVVVPGGHMKMIVKSADRAALTGKLEEAVRSRFTSEV
jgi:1-acyl-sn-glycerol-3-phosphate acyltransferase